MNYQALTRKSHTRVFTKFEYENNPSKSNGNHYLKKESYFPQTISFALPQMHFFLIEFLISDPKDG